mmetsp:Transcript_10028/g.18814  ORF Transcript_10028/g.18814 Transcript_10028/m.18814 type:complete len:80 (+) Transcript_10028:2702-2941(+)
MRDSIRWVNVTVKRTITLNQGELCFPISDQPCILLCHDNLLVTRIRMTRKINKKERKKETEMIRVEKENNLESATRNPR